MAFRFYSDQALPVSQLPLPKPPTPPKKKKDKQPELDDVIVYRPMLAQSSPRLPNRHR